MTAMTEKQAARYWDKIGKGVWFDPEKPLKSSGHMNPSEPERVHWSHGWAMFDTLVSAEVAYSIEGPKNEWFPLGTPPRVYVYAAACADDPAWMSVDQARAMAKAILKACRLAENPEA